MSFLSLEFAIFFPVVSLLYFAVPQRVRWVILLPSSYIFYMAWKPWYVLLLIFTTVFDYLVGVFLERVQSPRKRTVLLSFSLCANLGLLFFFKYHNWFARSVNDLFAADLIPLTSVLLPVGISFYTFQSMAYTIDVYRRRQKAEPHLGYYATYVAYFPQLVAGPIERAQNLLPQLHYTPGFEYDRLASGLKLMAWGFFKKAVVADRLATLVDPVYTIPGYYPSLPVLATLAFGIQIYCDFSGYSDIAIGAAEIMGIRLMKNFRAPYRAVSLQDFWRRWHISLSTWFRDYLYTPLIELWGSTKRATLVAAFVVFVVSGLWHGAAWTFFTWGMLHGVMYTIGRLTADRRARFFKSRFGRRFPAARKLAAIAGTFALVHFAWVFFRASSMSRAYQILRLAVLRSSLLLDPSIVLQDLAKLGWEPVDIVAAIYGILILFSVHQIQERHGSAREWLSRRHWVVRHTSYQVLIWSFILLGNFKHPQFIYFQF